MIKNIHLILLFIFITASSLQAKDERLYCAMLFTTMSAMSFQQNDIETGKFYDIQYTKIFTKIKKDYSDKELMKLMHDEMKNVLELIQNEDSIKIKERLTNCMLRIYS